jgi:cytochrome c5
MRYLLTPVLALVPLLAFAEDTPVAVDSAAGEAVYSQTCIACHGTNGKGAIPGVADFTDKDGSLSKADAVLIKNIIEGFQSPGSFMAMPPNGGNPGLTENDVKAVVAYLRTTFGS